MWLRAAPDPSPQVRAPFICTFVMQLHKRWSWKSSAMPGKCPSESCKFCRWDSSNSEPHSTVFWILSLFVNYLLAFGWGNTFAKAKFFIIKPLLQLVLGQPDLHLQTPTYPTGGGVLHLTLNSCFSPILDSLCI